jgi:hypothetical protein
VSGPLTYRVSRCPKCGERGLPQDQSLPAACPACGVILAKVAPALRAPPPVRRVPTIGDDASPGLIGRLLHVPERVDALRWWLRVLLLAGFALWGLHLIALDLRSGEIFQSFLHGPLLVFHEAGHVLFSPFGEFVQVLGGTLAQLLMPAVIVCAFLLRNRDPFGAAIGLWLLGVSLLDVAPYMVDALEPQLMLLSGASGEEGGHDWIHLFSSLGLLPRAQAIGLGTHRLGALVVLVALGWAAWVLRLQHRRIAGDLLREG